MNAGSDLLRFSKLGGAWVVKVPISVGHVDAGDTLTVCLANGTATEVKVREVRGGGGVQVCYPVERKRRARATYISSRYGTFMARENSSGRRCEDAPCCGCCG